MSLRAESRFEVSDFQKFLKAQSKSKAVKRAELGEQSEGVRDALKAGKGDIVAGTRRLGMKKEGLPSALRGAKCPSGKKPAKKGK